MLRKMEKYPLLKNAPITEAVINIKAKLSDDFDATNLASLSGLSKDDYPKKQEVKKFEGRFEFTKGKTFEPTTEEIAGYRFESEETHQVVQVLKEEFVFSKLKPYESWEELRDQARGLWESYKEVTSPELITRVALRYINKLNIPTKDAPWKFIDYLTAPPSVPDELPQAINNYFMRIVLPMPEFKAQAIIIQALEPVKKPQFVPVILDIDVFRFDPDGIKEDIWDILESLRVLKNRIFFNSITKKLEAIYNE